MSFYNSGERGVKETFTEDQQIAIDGIIDFIGKSFDSNSYIIGLSGPGGTGKTFITKYIIEHCRYSSSVIKCATPTHKACRVLSSAINGKTVDTIQSVFGLRLNLVLEDFDPMNPQFDPLSKVKLDDIKVLIIDEASMIPAKLVTYICKICKERFVKIIFIGDEYQLAPVNEKKSIAFHRCVKVYRLETIIRQDCDNPIMDILPVIRKDIKNRTYEFLSYISNIVGEKFYNENNEGFEVVNRTNFFKLINEAFSDKDYNNNIDMYRIIAYTNFKVSSYNNYIRNTIIKDADKNIITKNDLIMSYETIVNDFLETVINNSEEYIINDIVDYRDATYNFKGFLVKFQLIHGGNITKPLFIIDHRDKFTIVNYNRVVSNLILAAQHANGGNRSAKWREFYDFKKKYLFAANIISREGKILWSRDIDYGFALTSHKSQGSTYDNVFVDLNDIIFSKTGKLYSDMDDMLRRIYVACSRARKKLILCYGI